jgi:hypothetical protein
MSLGLIVDDCGHQEFLGKTRKLPTAFSAKGLDDAPPAWFPPLIVEFQGNTNSCAGHTSALASSHANYVKTGEIIRFSRRFAYVTAQAEGGFSGRDQGTSIESLRQAQGKYGCCLEVDDPFTERYNSGWARGAADLAALHRHHGDAPYDLRDWDLAMSWLTDRRPILIGTKWYSGQDSCGAVEDLRTVRSGKFRGYHARLLVGWDRVSRAEAGLKCQNSHGDQWADRGRSTIARDAWEWWADDPNFCAIGFNTIDEVEPQRRSWKNSKVGDVC